VERQPPVVAPQRKRPKRYHPTADCLGATRRLIRKLGERIARREVDGVGTDDLGALLELEGLVQDVAAQVVDRLREDGWSDGEIAEAARLRTKQAVQKRWPRRKEQA
jgi:hypothetical protein